MRIPDDIEDLVFSFIEPDAKKELRWMTRAEIDELIMRNIDCVLEPGYVEKSDVDGAFPYRVTAKGKAILQILSPCKRSGR
jgi:hypothetical protein